MDISDLIRELQESMARFGDVPVIYFDGAFAHEPEVFVGTHRTGNRFFIAQRPTGGEKLAASVPSKTDAVRERGESQHFYYIAREECGCITGVVVDTASHFHDVADDVAAFIRSGRTVERIAAESFNTGSLGCIHEKSPSHAPPGTTGAEQEPPKTKKQMFDEIIAKKQIFDEIIAEDARRAAEFQASRYHALTDSTTGDQSDPPTLRDFLGAPGNRIGVYDDLSFIECLTSAFTTVFPDYQGSKDPQNMIQLMGAEISRLRMQIEDHRNEIAKLAFPEEKKNA